LQRTRGVGFQAVSVFYCFDIARALREIAFYQKTVGLCIPRLGFSRLVREVVDQERPGCGLRMQASALAALQEGTEHIIVTYFELL
jgi:histone H3/H4